MCCRISASRSAILELSVPMEELSSDMSSSSMSRVWLSDAIIPWYSIASVSSWSILSSPSSPMHPVMVTEQRSTAISMAYFSFMLSVGLNGA